MGDTVRRVTNYADATSFDDEREAMAAITRYPGEASQFTIRRVTGAGFVVAISAPVFGWLHIGEESK